MKTPTRWELALLALAGAALADAEPLASTDAGAPYALDTAFPVALKAAGTAPIPLWRQPDDTVTATGPDGTSETVVGTSWGPSAGGLWTLRRTAQGLGADTALVTARHELFGTQGAGTAASPAKIVDADELVDLAEAGALRNGFTFALDGAESLLDSLRMPAGYRVEEAGGGLWRLSAAEGDSLYEWGSITYFLDSEGDGPDRRAGTVDGIPIAYTGDGWAVRSPSAASTLTLVSPSGATTVLDRQGTGVETARLREAGTWTLTLAYSGKTLVARIDVVAESTLVLFL